MSQKDEHAGLLTVAEIYDLLRKARVSADKRGEHVLAYLIEMAMIEASDQAAAGAMPTADNQPRMTPQELERRYMAGDLD